MPKLLLIAQTNDTQTLPATLPAITFAQQWADLTDGSFDIVVVGTASIADAASTLTRFGAGEVVVVASDILSPLSQNIAASVLAAAVHLGSDFVAGPSTQFGRDVLPRVAALMDAPMLTDVLDIEVSSTGLTFKRPMYAGNIIATVKLNAERGVFSIRTTAFFQPQEQGATSPISSIAAPDFPTNARWLSLDAPEQKRPDLSSARVVVSGGRPLRDAETFERLLGALADKLSGAVGATRAAVDSGIAPNELQVGQTGKIVAPDLYIAAGVSGSVQHLAGMRESKVIVAINNDPEAPIFQVADYGLVADLHQAVPELTELV